MRRTRPTCDDGFSLLEVVIAMGILAFGLLTLALMQLHALSQGSAGRHTGDAAAIGRSYLEQVNRLPWTAMDATETAGVWQTPAWAGIPDDDTTVASPHGGNAVEHAYTVEWKVDPVAGTACLRDVQLRVSWQEENRSTNKQVVLATRRYDTGGASC